jgi:hypothetical protein
VHESNYFVAHVGSEGTNVLFYEAQLFQRGKNVIIFNEMESADQK